MQKMHDPVELCNDTGENISTGLQNHINTHTRVLIMHAQPAPLSYKIVFQSQNHNAIFCRWGGRGINNAMLIWETKESCDNVVCNTLYHIAKEF